MEVQNIDLSAVLGLLSNTVELLLFFGGLEATVTELGGSIDELEGDLFQSRALGVGEEGLAQGDDTLLGTSDSTLDDKEVFQNLTVVGETTHGSDALLGKITFSGGVVVDYLVSLTGSLANTVNFLVDFGTVEETLLTGTSDGKRDTGRMPSSNTSDFAQTLVGLAGKLGDTPTGDDTLVTMTTGNSDGIDHFVIAEQSVDSDGLFEKAESEVNLLSDGTTIDLDFGDVSLLLTKGDLGDLRVSQNTDNLALVLDALELFKDGLLVISVLLDVLGEGFLLAMVPVLVETALALITEMLSPDGGQGAETTRSFNVTNNTDNNNWGSFNDGDSFNNFLLVELGTSTIDFTDDVGHTSLVTNEGSKVRGELSVILGETSDFSSNARAALAGQETQRTVAGSFELTVRHSDRKVLIRITIYIPKIEVL